MRSLTDAGYRVDETPRSPCSSRLQYARYWSHNDIPFSAPRIEVIVWTVSSDSGRPPLARRSLPSMMAAGSPGSSRGRRKFSEMAAHSVTM